MADLKKFLDQQGVSVLWSKVAEKVSADVAAEAKARDAAIAKAVADEATARGLAINDVVSDVEALEALVGKLPEGTTAKDVVDYVNIKTTGIATDAALGELNNQVSGLQTSVQNIAKDYLKAADKTELSDAIKAEETRAKGIEGGLETRLAAVEGDYLKAADKEGLQANIDAVVEDVAEIAGDYLKKADKTELEGKISAKADQTALDAVSAVANAAATQTALQGEVDRAKGEESRIEGLVTAEAERAANAEAGLQTQINTIMNNPDTEGVINSINEFTQYITNHGEIAEGFRTDIDANKKAIEDHEALAAQTYETKEDATAKYEEVKAEIAAIPQADWNQNDPAAADYVKNRTHYEDGEQTVFFEDNLGNLLNGSMGTKYFKFDLDFFDSLPVSDLKCEVGGNIYEFTTIQDGKQYRAENVLINGVSNQVNINKNSSDTTIMFDQTYGDGLSEITFRLFTGAVTIKQLDEKFIPDTIARVVDIEAAQTAAKTELEGKIALKADASALTSAVEALDGDIAELQAVDTALDGRIAAVEGDYLKTADKTALSNAIGLKADQADLEAEAALARAAEKANADAIAAIKDDANIDSFADVVAELAKKQNNIPENTYDAYGAAAQALTDAKSYTDVEVAKIQALSAAEIEAAIAAAQA